MTDLYSILPTKFSMLNIPVSFRFLSSSNNCWLSVLFVESVASLVTK